MIETPEEDPPRASAGPPAVGIVLQTVPGSGLVTVGLSYVPERGSIPGWTPALEAEAHRMVAAILGPQATMKNGTGGPYRYYRLPPKTPDWMPVASLMSERDR